MQQQTKKTNKQKQKTMMSRSQASSQYIYVYNIRLPPVPQIDETP